MTEKIKKRLNWGVSTALLMLGILAAFGNFLTSNSQRISEQNEEYIGELTIQRAASIDSMIEENLSFIRSTAYLYGKNLSEPRPDIELIREYEENTGFDWLRFIDASGDNYTSQGRQANLADRAYFQAGMRGGSGVTSVQQSRVTGERQIGFYAPVTYDGEIIGVMVGFYGEAYIQRMLEYELFGFAGDGWLCTGDGTVLGSTVNNNYTNLVYYLRDENRCSEEELTALFAAIEAGENTDFIYHENGQEATGYLVHLTQSDWILIRSFPPQASQGILQNANRSGEKLILGLVGLFGAYIVLITTFSFLEKKRIREANRDANDVSTGVTRLFDKFLALDMKTEEYRYISAAPEYAELPPQGAYSAFCRFITGSAPEDGNPEEAARLMSCDNIRRQLADTDRFSIRVHAVNGGREWYTFNYIALERLNGEAVRVLLVCQNVTELRRREEEEQQRLQDALEAAERASRAKTEFLFNMSHDLRTPMNAIIGYTELAGREGVGAEEMRDYIHKIDASGRHLLALINDILEMSRIESGKMTLEPARTDLRDVMASAEELFTAQMAEKGVTFAADVSGLEDRLVLCDGNRLNRVLLNLLSNAYKFTPSGGAVTVSLAQTGREDGSGRYELRVKDNGIGMSPEFASKLFTPFERERTSTVSGIQGTGLGLSITKSIVDLMGGSIEAVTAQGQGTEFIVRLRFPIAEEEAERDESAENAAPVDFGRVRLLLVEDNEINREIATLLLTQSGFALDTAENGRIAVDMVTAAAPGTYQAILMDVQMPVMNGYEATQAIRALPDAGKASIPIIAMTANAFREDVQAAIRVGMNGHIAKPIDVDKMLSTLSDTIIR